MEVEHYSIFLELEYILQSQAIQYPLHVDITFPLLGFRFKLARLAAIKKSLDVFSKIFLIDLFIERTVLIHDDALRLLVKVLDLVSDSVVNTLIENSEYIVFFPDVNVNIFEILFCLEKLPKVQFLELFLLHDFFQF